MKVQAPASATNEPARRGADTAARQEWQKAAAVDGGLSWFVIQAQPRKEAFVRDRIGDFGREVFLPLVVERRPGRRGRCTAPLFPGYLFARLSESAGDLARVRWTQGVSRVLGDRTGARAVPDEVVARIRSSADPQGKVRPGRRVRSGERVRIVDGPLSGLIGLLERPAASSEERVWVLVELFRRVTRVDLRSDEITGVRSAS